LFFPSINGLTNGGVSTICACICAYAYVANVYQAYEALTTTIIWTKQINRIFFKSQLQDSTANLNQLNLELTKIRGKHMNIKQRPVDGCYVQEKKDDDVRQSNKQVSEFEKNLYEGMSEVKRHQDSLKKGLNKLQNMLIKAKLDRPIQEAVAQM
jgi:hypothetical protein